MFAFHPGLMAPSREQEVLVLDKVSLPSVNMVLDVAVHSPTFILSYVQSFVKIAQARSTNTGTSSDAYCWTQTDPQFHKMQQLLREQEIVMLPDNGGLLMPVLTPDKKLVGLLMVERVAEADRAADGKTLETSARRPALQKAADGESA